MSRRIVRPDTAERTLDIRFEIRRRHVIRLDRCPNRPARAPVAGAPRRNGATTRTRTRDERRDRDRVRPSGSTRFVQFGVLRIRICSATRKTPDPPVFTTSTGALFIHGLQLLVLPPMQPPGCLTASSIVPQSETLTAVTIHMGSPSVGCGLTSALVTFCHPATGPK